VNLSDFHYDLPEELIAQEPLADRSASRMLVVHRQEGRWEDRRFRDLPEYLGPDDCLVLNNSKVLPSRLLGQRGNAQVEVFLLRPQTPDRRTWTALVKPGRRIREGDLLDMGTPAFPVPVEVIARGERGQRLVRFSGSEPVDQILETAGHVPLPPYIHRPDRPEDRDRYQTVYAKSQGSVAAPTAGLHFTPEVLEACRRRGAALVEVTLHVGLGTFQPLSTDHVEEAHLHEEWFEVTAETAQQIQQAARVLCIGTTSVRTVETAARRAPGQHCSGDTNLFIYPGFEFLRTGALLTNFHLPSTSLLLLVAAFAGRDLVLDAYRHAVAHRYRFYSYGDCMLLL
jgi:S-adenosylmethionine:tRNA ribosyltransferase-isomerase